MPEFIHHDLSLLNPSFDSPLVDVLTELEHLRRLQLGGTTPAHVFFQLKAIFHKLESLGSARIEGNHTTLADYVESDFEENKEDEPSDQLRELKNIEAAMKYVEDEVSVGFLITEGFIRELHGIAVEDLVREGDKTPGQYRSDNVKIAKSEHLPPNCIQVKQYMEDLVDFINNSDAPKYDLIKVAMAHHRFGWVHPFGNGNGRVVRLLTYALLIKFGFNVDAGGRVLNPTAVFCNDRDVYYDMLGVADDGTREGIEAWCIYVLRGILVEINKVNKLSDLEYLSAKILSPALRFAKDRKLITPMEESILLIAAKKGLVKAADFSDAMSELTAGQRTYQLKKLVGNRMLLPIAANSRQYTIGFDSNYLIRGVIDSLTAEGFISREI